ncbi:unnamed protein product [Arabidopsis halleri]
MNEPLLNHFHAQVPFLFLSLPLHRTLRPLKKKRKTNTPSVSKYKTF